MVLDVAPKGSLWILGINDSRTRDGVLAIEPETSQVIGIGNKVLVFVTGKAPVTSPFDDFLAVLLVSGKIVWLHPSWFTHVQPHSFTVTRVI